MLTDEEAQKVRLVLASSGWNDVMRPAIENRGRNALKSLTMTVAERSVGQFKNSEFDTSDDVLRAIIKDCNWMVVCWYNELKVSEHNRQMDELHRQDSNEGTAAANPR